MTHPLLQTLRDHDAVTALTPGSLGDFLGGGKRAGLTVVFLAGDPEKKLETADVAVVVMELLKAYPGALRVGLTTPAAEKEIMEATAVYALPSLVFFAGDRKLETISKIQDWSVYAETVPRLIADVCEGAPA